MAGLLNSGESALAGGASASGSSKLEEPDHSSSNWYFTRDEIECNSPSRKDGIDLKRETYFRKSYCTFLQDLGMRLKVPQVTIATAIVFCHRFFLRQSHHKNDRLMIATICMFLAGKVEETPRGLVDVILMSYEIRFKKDQGAIQRIKQNQKEVVDEQKELVLVGERLVLTTLGFDLNIHHPYKPLVAAIKKFKVAQNALAQVAWNFVNDGLRTSLCLQFKPHHIAAGAIFLAAKFLKVKLPSDGEKVWWQEFDVTPRQLEEVSNQMLELYEQNKAGGLATAGAGSRSSDPSASAGVAGNRNRISQSVSKVEVVGMKSETAEEDWKAPTGPVEVKQETVMEVNTETKCEPLLATSESADEDRKPRAALEDKEMSKDAFSQVKTEAVTVKSEVVEEERKPWAGLEEINKDKVKAALARRKSKSEGDTKQKLELADDDELLQRALEGDVDVSADTEKPTHERRDAKSKHGHRVEHDLPEIKKDRAEETEHATKRKRIEDEDLPSSDRRWSKPQENGDVRESRDNRDARENRDNRDARDSRDNRETRETREPHRGRDGAAHEKWGGDNRSNGSAMHRHGHTRGDGYYHHSNSHQHHHGDRERYHSRDRDWQERERDYKKSRHDQETLQPVPLRSSVF